MDDVSVARMAYRMASVETVEKLRARAGVSYDEAREALDVSDDDVFDALIWLEKNGKTKPPGVSSYSTEGDGERDGERFGDIPQDRANRFYDSRKVQAERKKKNDKRREYNYNKKDYSYARESSAKKAYYYDEGIKRGRSSSFFQSVFGFIGKAFRIGNATMFEITRYEHDIIKLPLTILVVAFFLFFQVTLILLPVGLFFGFRYKITGEHFNSNPLNSVMNTAADAVDGIKDAISKNKRG